ncbi:hypothetical protein NDU88_006020 [Pleurodeles waltl]|uniref:Uncharacterized protein n=1 Tax=Pleurodeles waltl TaxID=8319 RepID=A0AAV7LMV8_PLEWA|nr:hypothetical protein NDU88_006020 [Pleurodeles waltl]
MLRERDEACLEVGPVERGKPPVRGGRQTGDAPLGADETTTTQRLKAEGLPYTLLFSARLRVTYIQKAHFFDTPELVRDWLDTTFPHPGPKEHEDTLPLRQAHQPHKDK